MAIPAAAKPTPIPRIDVSTRLVDPKTGVPDTHGLQRIERLRGYVSGMGRCIPCAASGTNVITLTPNGHGSEDGEAPVIEKYVFGDSYLFWAAETSTGDVTATVVPKTGTLSTLKVFVDDGAAQATTGDVVQNSVYEAFYAPHLDANNGGLVLK
jgi:hypothetical protein